MKNVKSAEKAVWKKLAKLEMAIATAISKGERAKSPQALADAINDICPMMDSLKDVAMELDDAIFFAGIREKRKQAKKK